MSQMDKLRDYLSERKEAVHIDAIEIGTGIKLNSLRALLSLGCKKGLFVKTGVKTYTINYNPLVKEVICDDNKPVTV